MEPIIQLTKIDYISLFIEILVILIGIKAITSIFEWVINKLGLETKWMQKRREEHNLLITTANELKNLSIVHKQDIDKIYEDNLKWRDQSREIKESYNKHFQHLDTMQEQTKQFLENEKLREKQINSLTIASRELLAEKINDKYKYYISIGGIPEDEVDEFTALHGAYNGCGGNHHGDAKYNYIMEHMPVIPVKTKLVTYKETDKREVS